MAHVSHDRPVVDDGFVLYGVLFSGVSEERSPVGVEDDKRESRGMQLSLPVWGRSRSVMLVKCPRHPVCRLGAQEIPVSMAGVSLGKV
jgi:hypothetical protein